jgi:hypothetical protein
METVARVLVSEYLQLLTFAPYALAAFAQRNSRIDELRNGEIAVNFRFRSKQALHRIMDLLQIPLILKAPSRHVFTGEECLLFLLYRLKSPEHLAKQAQFFGGAKGYKKVSKGVILLKTWLIEKWGYLLLDNLRAFLPNFRVYADVIRVRMEHNSATLGPNNPIPAALQGMPMDPQTGQGFDVVGFIDGSLHAGCRPGGGPVREGILAPRHDDELQRAFYQRRGRIHGLNWLISSAPDGMIMFAWGPTSARRHDAMVYHKSGLNPAMRDLQIGNVEQYCVFGDSAYPFLSHTTKNMPHRPVGEHYAYNSVREVVEWDWRDIKHFWSRCNARKYLQVRKKPTGMAQDMFLTILFKNLYACEYGSQTSRYFDLLPPTLEAYLAQGPR